MSQMPAAIVIPLTACLLAGCSISINTPPSVIVGSGPTIQGNGIASSQIRPTPQFHKIRSEGSASISIARGPTNSVEVLGDSNIIPLVKTDVQGGVLTVSVDGNYSPRTPLTVQLIAPAVDSLTIDGSGSTQLSGLSQSRLDVNINGSGHVDASGYVDALSVGIAGSGDVQSRSLQARDVDVSISGSGSADVTATRSIDGNITGSGNVLYYGKPGNVTVSISGSGEVNSG